MDIGQRNGDSAAEPYQKMEAATRRIVLGIAGVAVLFGIYADLKHENDIRQHALTPKECGHEAGLAGKRDPSHLYKTGKDSNGNCTLTITKKDFTPA